MNAIFKSKNGVKYILLVSETKYLHNTAYMELIKQVSRRVALLKDWKSSISTNIFIAFESPQIYLVAAAAAEPYNDFIARAEFDPLLAEHFLI